MWIIPVMVACLGIVVLAEYLSRRKGVHAELSRKFIHISVGIFAASWPFFLSWGQIQLLALIFLAGMLVSVKFKVFQSIHGVDRKAHGEILSVVAVGILAFITTSDWVFAAAMLYLGLADGIAAIVGLMWGRDNQYKIFGYTKSVAGSIAFFVCGVLISILYTFGSGVDFSLGKLIFLPLAATAAENIAVNGADNLIIPIFVALVLSAS